MRQAGQIERIVMTQRKPQFLSLHDPAEVLPLFGLHAADALPEAPIQTVSTGTPQLMAPAALAGGAAPRPGGHRRIRALSHSAQTSFQPHLFCLQGLTPAGRTFARHFGTPPDLLEDPFTGSATGGMAAYCGTTV